MMRLFILTTFFLLLSISNIHAQEIESPQYRILQPTIALDGTDQGIQTSLSRSDFIAFQQRGYIIREPGVNSLRATLSHATLTFEGTPQQANNVSTVLTTTANGVRRYQSLITSRHPLETIWGDEIPATNCDTGCTINVARPWTEIDSMGFGYTLKGDDIPSDFKEISYFRKLPEQNRGDLPISIIHGTFIKDTRQTTLIFRVNVPKNQPDGTYQTIMDLFVSPMY